MSNQIQFQTIGEQDIIKMPAKFTEGLSHHWEMLNAVIPVVIETMIGDSNLPTQNAAHILKQAFENFKDDFNKIGEK